MRKVRVYIELEVDPTWLYVGRPEARAEHAAPRGDHAAVTPRFAAATCKVTRAAGGVRIYEGKGPPGLRGKVVAHAVTVNTFKRWFIEGKGPPRLRGAFLAHAGTCEYSY